MPRLAGFSIFVFEHDAADANVLRTVLETAGADVMFASDPDRALARVNRFIFNAVILDGIDCDDVCKALGSGPFMFYVGRDTPISLNWPSVPIIIKTASAAVIIDAVAKLVGTG